MTICKKCGRKIKPIFSSHIYNGSEHILHGSESVMNGHENIKNGHEVKIQNFICPFCGTKHKNGQTIKR